MPIQPFNPPGLLNVPIVQLQQFLSGFPLPPGVTQVAQAADALFSSGAQALATAAQSGDAQRVIAAIGMQAAKLAPGVLTAAGALISASGVAAGVLGPFTAGIPYVGAVAPIVLEIYAPLATVGGQTVAGAAAAAAALNAAVFNQQAAAAAAAAANRV